MWLLSTHLEPIEEVLAQNTLPELAGTPLEQYASHIRVVAEVAAHHQRIVIDGLHGRLRASEAADLGLRRPDHLETGRALINLAQLGQKEDREVVMPATKSGTSHSVL